MKKVTVFQSQTSETQEIEVNEDVKTWGELQNHIDFDLTDKKVVVKETRNTLEADDAVLPEGDITLFMYVSKSKGGASDPTAPYVGREGKKRIKSMAGNNLRRSVRKLNQKGITDIDTSLSTEEQREELLDHFHGSKATKTLSELESKPAKKKAKAKKKSKPAPAPVAELDAQGKVDAGSIIDYQGEHDADFRVEPEPEPNPSVNANQISLNLTVDQKEVISKLDNIAEKLESYVERIEELPELIAEKLKDTKKIVEATQELKDEAYRIKRQIGL